MTLTPDQQAMVEANTGLVGHVLAKHRVSPSDWDDCFQDGLLGLIRAVELFDPTKGFKFSTYAVWWIRQGIQKGRGQQYGRDYRRAVRTHTSFEPPLTLDANLGNQDSTITYADTLATVDPDTDTTSPVAEGLCRDDLDRAVLQAVTAGHPLRHLAARFGVGPTTPTMRWWRIRSHLRHPTMRHTTKETP